MLRSLCALLALTHVQATFNALQNAGVTVIDNTGATIDPAKWFDFNTNTKAVDDSTITFVTFQFPYAINLKSVFFSLYDADTTNSVKIWTSVDGLSFTQCGGTFTRTWIEQCERVVTHIKVEQPFYVRDLCAFVWQVNPATPIASMYASSSGKPVNSPLSITTSKKLINEQDHNFTYSTVSAGTTCGDLQSQCRWWKMEYTTSVYVRYVLVLKQNNGGSGPLIYAYNTNEIRSNAHQCTKISQNVNHATQVLYSCYRTAQIVEVRWADSENQKLYYVKDFIAPASCETLINGGCSLASFTTGLSTVPTSIYMSSPSTTVPLSSITSLDQSCCPLTWFVDTSATTAGFPVTIDISTQDLVMSPTTAIYHVQTVVTLAVKFVFWEGSASPSLSSSNSLSITISCSTSSENKFTIGGNFVESVLTSYTGLLGFPDFSTCLGPNPNYQFFYTPYIAYVSSWSNSAHTFQLDFTKRTSTAYSDGPFNVDVEGVSSQTVTKWYSRSVRLDSIDCFRGLTMPNPLRLKLGTGSNTTDLRQSPNTLFFSEASDTTITITDSGWTFQDLSPVTDPISSCGSITASIVSSVSGFVSFTANPLVFQLDFNVVSIGTTVINMKLQLQNVNLPAPQEFPFTLQVDCASTIISSGSQPSDPVAWQVPNTVMVNDFKYTWNPFTFFRLCPVNTYQVTCTEGAGNIGSGRCSQGFHYNQSRTTAVLASINSLGSPMIPVLTIYAQYAPATAITLDHEGEFTFKIEGWYSGAPTNKGTISIILKITVPCDNPDNVINPQVHQFICSTGLCNDVFYTIFTNQQNPFVADTHRFSYSCRMTFILQIESLSAPSFIQLKDASGNPAYQDDLKPVFLEINSSSNDDYVAYSGKTLTLVLSVGTGAGLKTLSHSFGLNIFPDCTTSKAPMAQQTLPQNPFSFIVSQQHLPSTYGYVNSLTFGKFEPTNPTDKAACAVNDAGLSLNQIDRASTISASYDPNLFNFVKNQAGSTNKIDIWPSFNSHVMTDLSATSTACNLELTDMCAVDFEIKATNLNSTQVVVTGTVNFETECKLFADWEKYRREQSPPRPSSWEWTLSSFQTYRVRDPELVHEMPTFHPKLPSIDTDILAVPVTSSYSFTDLCGGLTYFMTGVNTPVPFRLEQVTTPKLYVYTEDPEEADKNNKPTFERTHQLLYSVSLNRDTTIKLSYTDTQLLFNISVVEQYIDCTQTQINVGSQPSQPAPWVIPNTVMTNDFKYTWNAFTFNSLCPVDTYQVTCTEGTGNLVSSLCAQGFQYNESLTTPVSAAINSLGSPMIPTLSIYAQYDPATAITLDHEGEFTFKIEGWYSGAPSNKGIMSITLKIINTQLPIDNCKLKYNSPDQFKNEIVMPQATFGTESVSDLISFVLPTLKNPCSKQVNLRIDFMGPNLKDCISIENDSVLQVSAECVRKMKLNNPAVIQISVRPSLNNIMPDDVLVVVLIPAEEQEPLTKTEEKPVEQTASSNTSTDPEQFIATIEPVSVYIPKVNQFKQSNTKKYEVPLVLKVGSMTSDGYLTLFFNKPIQLNEDYFKTRRKLQGFSKAEEEKVLEQVSNAFQIEYRPKPSEYQAQLLNTTVVEFKDMLEIKFKLSFSEPLYVSYNAETSSANSRDQLIVSLKHPQTFIDPSKGEPLKATLFESEAVPVPKQAPTIAAQTVQIAQKAAQNFATMAIPGTIVMNILFGISLYKLWTAVNLLQFLIYIKYWNLSPPQNVETFFDKINFFATLGWLPKQHIIRWLGMSASDDDDQGLRTRFLIVIIAALGFFVVLIGGLIFLCQNNDSWISRLAKDQKKKFFWNGVIRTSLQSYLDFAVSSLTVLATASTSSAKSISLASFSVLILVGLPVCYYMLLNKHKNQIRRSRQLEETFGTLYLGIDKTRFSAIIFNIVFLARRFIYALVSTFIGQFDGGLTLVIACLISFGYHLYIVNIRPQQTANANKIELASEVLLLYSFFGIMVCEQEENPVNRYGVGWFSVSLIVTIVAIQIVYMLSDAAAYIIQKIKVRNRIKRHLRMMELKAKEESQRIKEQAIQQQTAQQQSFRIKTLPAIKEFNKQRENIELKHLGTIQEQNEDSGLASSMNGPARPQGKVRLSALDDVEKSLKNEIVQGFNSVPMPVQQRFKTSRHATNNSPKGTKWLDASAYSEDIPAPASPRIKDAVTNNVDRPVNNSTHKKRTSMQVPQPTKISSNQQKTVPRLVSKTDQRLDKKLANDFDPKTPVTQRERIVQPNGYLQDRDRPVIGEVRQQHSVPRSNVRNLTTTPEQTYSRHQEEDKYNLPPGRRPVSPLVWKEPAQTRMRSVHEEETKIKIGQDSDLYRDRLDQVMQDWQADIDKLKQKVAQRQRSDPSDEILQPWHYKAEPVTQYCESKPVDDRLDFLQDWQVNIDEIKRKAYQKQQQQQVDKMHLMQPEPKDSFRTLQEARSRQASPQIKQAMTSTSARQPSQLFMIQANQSTTTKTTLTYPYQQPYQDNYHLGERDHPYPQATGLVKQPRNNSVNSLTAPTPAYRQPRKQQMMRQL